MGLAIGLFFFILKFNLGVSCFQENTIFTITVLFAWKKLKNKNYSYTSLLDILTALVSPIMFLWCLCFILNVAFMPNWSKQGNTFLAPFSPIHVNIIFLVMWWRRYFSNSFLYPTEQMGAFSIVRNSFGLAIS